MADYSNMQHHHGGDEELELIKRRLQEVEQETSRLEELQAQIAKDSSHEDANKESDARSIYVGNVDYGATPEEIQAHFQACGTINRITILCDKWTGHPKGFAYVEFADPSSVPTALALHDSLFRGRLLKVSGKRTNMPGLAFRGGFRGRGRGMHPAHQMGYQPMMQPAMYHPAAVGYPPAPMPYFRGRGAFPRPYRGRGRGRGVPY